MTELRPLNTRQVVTCETGQTTRCRCRCGGQMHGAKRSRMPEFYEKLPPSDPHHMRNKSRQLPLPPPIGAPL